MCASAALSLLLFGNPLLWPPKGWYLWAVPQASPRLHLAGSAALVLRGFALWVMPPYVALILVGACLNILAVLDKRLMPAIMVAEMA